MNRYLNILLLWSLTFFWTACSDPQRKGPTETAQVFLDAVSSGDYPRAKEVCTPGTSGNLDMFESFSSFGANPMSGPFSIKREEINGEYATVYYEKEGKEHYLRLHKEDGKWQVIANKGDLSTGGDEESKGESAHLDEKATESDDTDPADAYLDLRSGKSAKDIADKFLMAFAYSDYEKAKQYASKESAGAIDMQSGLGGGDGIVTTEYKITKVKENGDYASVYYKDGKSSEEKELKLGKDKHGNWQVIMTKSDF